MKGYQVVRLPRYVTGLVNQELLLQVEYLAAENRNPKGARASPAAALERGTGPRIIKLTTATPNMPQRDGMVTTGRFALGPVSAMVNSCISCANARLETRSLSSIQNQVSR